MANNNPYRKFLRRYSKQDAARSGISVCDLSSEIPSLRYHTSPQNLAIKLYTLISIRNERIANPSFGVIDMQQCRAHLHLFFLISQRGPATGGERAISVDPARAAEA
jgi:hypothetical protein